MQCTQVSIYLQASLMYNVVTSPINLSRRMRRQRKALVLKIDRFSCHVSERQTRKGLTKIVPPPPMPAFISKPSNFVWVVVPFCSFYTLASLDMYPLCTHKCTFMCYIVIEIHYKSYLLSRYIVMLSTKEKNTD